MTSEKPQNEVTTHKLQNTQYYAAEKHIKPLTKTKGHERPRKAICFWPWFNKRIRTTHFMSAL